MRPQVVGWQPAAALRVGDAERDTCIDDLQFHYGQGRLDDAELSGRLDQALAARTDADLAALVADLPPRRGTPGRSTGAGRPRSFKVAVGLAAAIAVLAATGGLAEGHSDPAEEYGYGSEICQATGLPALGDDACSGPSDEQEKLISDAVAAAESAEQAQEATRVAPDNAQVAKLADQAQAAAERAARAVTDSQIIVATAPDERPEKGALKEVAKRAQEARRDAARAALEAAYQAENG